MVESLKLPKDSFASTPDAKAKGYLKGRFSFNVKVLTGNTDAFVENYKGILEYTSTVILLQGKTCKIEICGKRLTIVYYTNEDMKISGWIESVRYLS